MPRRSREETKKRKLQNIYVRSLQLSLVPLTIPFSNSFYQNLTDIYSLKELLYNTGIADYQGLPLVKPDNGSDLLLPQGY